MNVHDLSLATDKGRGVISNQCDLHRYVREISCESLTLFSLHDVPSITTDDLILSGDKRNNPTAHRIG